MFRLYSFDPDHVLEEGYKLEGSYDSEQACNQAAFELGVVAFRIEHLTPGGSVIIFESEHER